MVEGPGCKLKGQKIKAKLRGQVVRQVQGNAVDKQCKKSKGDNTSQFHQLIGRKLDDVQTLGKELFMYFADCCLRVHFLMAGQSFINHQKVDNDFGGNAETATLELQFSQDVLTFKKSSVDMRLTDVCKQKYIDLNDVDICSPIFNFKRAVAMVMEQKGRLICDVLLDQALLPGVGNIIKNEALFDSGIKPNTKVEELQAEHVSHLVKMTRDFTNIFYQCRRDGKPLHPYMKIYKKHKCGQCQGKVTVCRLGDDNDRVTYFCEHCQTNDLKTVQRKLPTKNSLLGWVTQGAALEQPKPDWSCDVCTLINTASQSSCQACQSPKPGSQSGVSTQITDQSEVLIDLTSQTDSCGNGSMRPSQNNDRTVSNGSTRPLSAQKVQQNSVLALQSTNTQMPGGVNVVSSANVSGTRKRSIDTGAPSQPSKLIRTHNGLPRTTGRPSVMQQQKNQSAAGKNMSSQSEASTVSRIPCCPDHKKKCKMREVHKKGDNLGRFFFSCSQRSCKFFQWADTSFPLCPGHGKHCTIRTVMKIGPNNGRKFFTCKLPKSKQCQYFEWAQGYESE